MKQPKPGDKIIITDPILKMYGEELTVVRVDKVLDCAWVNDDIIGMHGIAWFPRGSYQILEEDGTKVEVGDRIVVTDPHLKGSYCQVLIVIAAGIDWVSGVNNIGDDKGSSLTLWSGKYRLLKRLGSLSSSVCRDCNGTGKIELFTSVVSCKCTKGERK